MMWLKTWNISRDWPDGCSCCDSWWCKAVFSAAALAQIDFWAKQQLTHRSLFLTWTSILTALLSSMVSDSFRTYWVQSYDCTPQLFNNTSQDVNESWAYCSIQRTGKIMSDYPSRGEKSRSHVDSNEKTIALHNVNSFQLGHLVQGTSFFLEVWMNAFVKEKPWSWQWPQHNAFAYCGSPFLQHPNFHVGDTVDARGTLEVATFMSIWMEQHGQLKASHEPFWLSPGDLYPPSDVRLQRWGEFWVWVWCLLRLFDSKDVRQEACLDRKSVV